MPPRPSASLNIPFLVMLDVISAGFGAAWLVVVYLFGFKIFRWMTTLVTALVTGAVAFVVVRPGYQLDGDELLKFCAERIAKYKTPKEVILREALPRNAAGKVLKPTLRREVSEPKS